jgi:hypothetical protein
MSPKNSITYDRHPAHPRGGAVFGVLGGLHAIYTLLDLRNPRRLLIRRSVLCIRRLALGHHHRDVSTEMLFTETESLLAITAVAEVGV